MIYIVLLQERKLETLQKISKFKSKNDFRLFSKRQSSKLRFEEYEKFIYIAASLFLTTTMQAQDRPQPQPQDQRLLLTLTNKIVFVS